jgi:hypothetical protein
MQLFIHHLSQTLTTLILKNNPIGNQGAEHLANALQQNEVTSLTRKGPQVLRTLLNRMYTSL